MVTAPTRERNILDLILCNNTELVTEIKQEVNNYLLDHNTLFVKTFIYADYKPPRYSPPTFYTTCIHLYDLENATEDEWSKYEEQMNDKFDSIIENLEKDTDTDDRNCGILNSNNTSIMCPNAERCTNTS